jgi:hypothetical protein
MALGSTQPLTEMSTKNLPSVAGEQPLASQKGFCFWNYLDSYLAC